MMEQIAQQFTAALQAIQQQNATQAAQFNRALGLLQEQQQRQQETLATMAAGTGATSSGIPCGVVDVKQVGKPDLLKGSKDTIAREWPSWSFMFLTWFCSQFFVGERAMEWAKGEPNTIGLEEVTVKAREDGWNDLVRLNSQLQVALVSLCRDEALLIIRNSAKGSGLDAWRRLAREYEPNTEQSNLRLLKRVLQPRRVTLDQLRATMETWERELREYVERTGEQLSDSEKRLTLLSMCPQAVEEHCSFHSARLDSYPQLQDEIDAYLSIKISTTGAIPMDLDALSQNQPKGKPKGKGKTKGDAAVASTAASKKKTCFRCGREGHMKAECWSKTTVNGETLPPRADAQKGKGGSTKNKGNQKGRGKGKRGIHGLEQEGGEPQEEATRRTN